GETVGPDKALTLSAYFAAIRAISEDVAKLPLILYERMEPRGKRRMPKHPVYRLLHDEPNPEMSSMSFRETLTLHAIGWGNGCAEIVRSKQGRALALWPLDPARVRIERDDAKRIVYIVQPVDGGKEITFASRDIFHLHGLGFDGLTGYSVAHLARESIGGALAAERSGAALFGNGSRPGGVLEHPGVLSDEARMYLRQSWEEKHKGAENANKTAILEQGLQFKPISIPNKDAQWIEAREFMVSELARWLRIPPHKIAHMRDATFSNIESQAREYVTDTLQPWHVRWEQEIARKLIPARSGLFAEHLVDGLLRGDTETRFNAYRTAILAGWMSRNEARALENMNPADGLDTFLEPLNTGPVGEPPTSN
ncbi:MAG: phage portal protein, partial [Planctomycetota bacterium]